MSNAFKERFAKMSPARQAVVKAIARMPAAQRGRLLKLEALRRGIDLPRKG